MEPAEKALETIFDLLSEPWINNFIFPTEQTSHVEQLCNTLTQPFRLLVAFNYLSEPLLNPNPTLMSSQESCALLFLHTFTNGFKSVGFSIKKSVIAGSPFGPRYISRVVRDDARGILCTIAEHDQHTELAYYRQVKRGCREHMYAILSRDMFRNLFNKSYFDPYVARHAMNSCLCAIETRPCPICGLAYQLCTCSQPFENISSSNDHSTSLQNSRLFGGSYQGNAVFGMYVDGVGHVLGRCLTENAIHFAQDDVTQSDIECWAVSDVVRKSQIYVTKLALPDAGVCTFVDRGAASAQVWGIGGLRGGDDVCAQGTVGERECIFECTEDRFEDEASRVPPVELSEDNSAVEGNGTRIACDLPLTGGLTEAVVGDGPVPQRIGDDANACDSIDEGGSRADETQTIDRASNPTPKRKGVQYLRRPALISGGCSWGEVKETVSRIWSTAPAILPRPADQEIRTPYVDRRQYMLQARKMRNRESAKRSNIRKKAAYRKLRDEIEHAETEKVRLKEKERGLQTENRMLKAALLQ